MMTTARDVTTGNANSVPGGPAGGHPAAVGPDLATGHGLVDAHKAVMVAKVQCLGPVPITVPIISRGPITPITGPVTPVQPITGPIRPITAPVTPVQPITGPIRPITPVQPIRPIAPIVNPGPVQPGPAGTEGSGEGGHGTSQSALSTQDVETLSNLIINSELEID